MKFAFKTKDKIFIYLFMLLMLASSSYNLIQATKKQVVDNRLKHIKEVLILEYDLSEIESEFFSIYFDKFSKQYNMDWTLFAALVRIESNFDPTARSDAGAFGYTQLMEPTFKEQCQKIGVEKPIQNDVVNLVLGIRYFMEGYDGNLESALKRYNGGPGYKKASKENRKAHTEYCDKILSEKKKLDLIFKGLECK